MIVFNPFSFYILSQILLYSLSGFQIGKVFIKKNLYGNNGIGTGNGYGLTENVQSMSGTQNCQLVRFGGEVAKHC